MRRLVLTALALWAFAGVAYAARVLTFGSRPAYVHVRWAPTVDADRRIADERKYGLRQPELKEGRTFGYALTDLSRANVRALVTDPDVEDTHNINRLKFRPGLFTPRLPYATAVPAVPVALNVLSALLLLGGVAALGVATLARVAPRALPRPRMALEALFLEPRAVLGPMWRRVSARIGERIPEVSAQSAGLFRIVFGGALLIFVLNRPVLGTWAATPDNVVSAFQQMALDVLVRAPWVAEAIRPWIVFWGALFILGVMTRTAFAMLALGILPWALLYTTRVTHHTISALMLTLLFLQRAPWGDALSVDAWRRGRTRLRTPREYGYVVWAPGLVLGVVFAAAAFAKLRESGLAWILNGTVKYHFLSDAAQAVVDWGLYVGRYPAAAVLLSFAAIAIESLVIIGVFARRYVYRATAGLAAMSLLTGFLLFQGLRWPAWWMLLLSFLPWHLVRKPQPLPEAAATTSSVTWPAVAVVALFGVQTLVSSLKLEITPLFSTYDMYSTTYASTEEYKSKGGLSYWLVGERGDGTTGECRVSRRDADLVSRAIADPAQWGAATSVLDGCFEPSSRITRVSVQGRHSEIDWTKTPPAEVVTVRLAGPSPVTSGN